MMLKQQLLAALDAIIAEVREATAAIQRDDYDAALAKFRSASAGLRDQAERLGRAA